MGGTSANNGIFDGMISRRLLLSAGIASIAGLAAPAVLAKTVDARRLQMLNLHTGDRFAGPYWMAGRYLKDALDDINHVLRDHRSGEAAAMAPGLLDLVHRLSMEVRADDAYRIVSGYRSPATNAKLRAQGHGVAKSSYHTRAMAIDLSLANRKLSQLRDTAKALKKGGVGYYPKSGFVHVDVGPIRYW